MTPKEKATEIILKSASVSDGHSEIDVALLVVDEVLLALKVDNCGDVFKFYTEVRQEIETL